MNIKFGVFVTCKQSALSLLPYLELCMLSAGVVKTKFCPDTRWFCDFYFSLSTTCNVIGVELVQTIRTERDAGYGR